MINSNCVTNQTNLVEAHNSSCKILLRWVSKLGRLITNSNKQAKLIDSLLKQAIQISIDCMNYCNKQTNKRTNEQNSESLDQVWMEMAMAERNGVANRWHCNCIRVIAVSTAIWTNDNDFDYDSNQITTKYCESNKMIETLNLVCT